MSAHLPVGILIEIEWSLCVQLETFVILSIVSHPELEGR